MEHIRKNLEIIKNKIAEAADKSGRSEDDITLVGVTKTISIDAIRNLISLGVNNLGENRVQELAEKYPLIDNGSWHLIGNLQKNKVRHIIDKVILIQSVESFELGEIINKMAERNGAVMDILLETNIAGEATKHGLPPEDVLITAKRLVEFKNIRLRGLMTVAPFVENQEANRDLFKKMYNLYVDIREKIDNNGITILSMGMTGDYVTAIEEGATMIRVGTGIFRERSL